MLFFVLLTVAVVIIVATTVGNITSSTANSDFFTVGIDEVPSVKLILGEVRDVISVSKSTSSGVVEMVVKYSVSSNQNEEMFVYATALCDDYEYYRLNDNNFERSTGRDFQFATESVEDGYIVIVTIDYDTSGYTLTITRSSGTLTIQ